jgi:hypothetical protein
LAAHWAPSTFLRPNSCQAPIGQTGRFAGRYVAKFEGEHITDAAVYCTTYGSIIVQALTNVAAVIASCILIGKPISGILGSLGQAETAGDARGLRACKTLMATPEILYALDFAALKIPALLENETVHCRRARTDDLEMLVEWRAAYYAEALFAQNNDALLERSR